MDKRRARRRPEEQPPSTQSSASSIRSQVSGFLRNANGRHGEITRRRAALRCNVLDLNSTLRPAHSPLLFVLFLLPLAAAGCATDTSPTSTTTTTATPTTVTPSTFTITWNSTTFPATVVGTTSSTPVVITLWNTGTTSVAIGNVTDSNLQQFPWTTTCAINGQLAAGTSCAITTEFKPSALGAQSATLTISANAKDETLSLTGAGTQAVNPQLSIMPTTGSASTLFALTLAGATRGGQLSLHTTYTPAPGNAPIDFSTTFWTADSSGQLTVTSSHDSPGTFENWFVDSSSGLSSNHVVSVVQ